MSSDLRWERRGFWKPVGADEVLKAAPHDGFVENGRFDGGPCLVRCTNKNAVGGERQIDPLDVVVRVVDWFKASFASGLVEADGVSQ